MKDTNIFEKENISADNELLRSIAHDLRSPLAVIKSFADALRDRSIPENERELSLTLISLEAERLSRLASRLCTDPAPKIGVFDICETARRVFLMLKPKFMQRSLQISFSFGDDEGEYVSADADMIYEVIYNLAENAQKYTPHGGDISFLVTRADGSVTFAVSNTAEPDTVDTRVLFDKYTRGKNADGAEGYGLGLYVTRNLLEAHGKAISAEYRDGRMVFSFTLDAAD